LVIVIFLLGGAFGLILGTVIALILETSFFMMIGYSIVGAFISVSLFAISPSLFLYVLNSLIFIIGWQLHVMPKWKELPGRKVIIYHRLDGIVPHK
jgi:hypothetical protein